MVSLTMPRVEVLGSERTEPHPPARRTHLEGRPVFTMIQLACPSWMLERMRPDGIGDKAKHLGQGVGTLYRGLDKKLPNEPQLPRIRASQSP